jgi:hypothetical protein
MTYLVLFQGVKYSTNGILIIVCMLQLPCMHIYQLRVRSMHAVAAGYEIN